VSGQLHSSVALPPEENRWIGGSVDPRVSLDAVE
jgi:hypothetical protein